MKELRALTQELEATYLTQVKENSQHVVDHKRKKLHKDDLFIVNVVDGGVMTLRKASELSGLDGKELVKVIRWCQRTQLGQERYVVNVGIGENPTVDNVTVDIVSNPGWKTDFVKEVAHLI